MKPPKNPDTPPNDPYGCDEPDSLNIKACSATDCTGLIPAPPQSDAEEEAYEELYPFLPQAAGPKEDHFS